MLKHPGFTLIELLTVVTILGILFVITVPEYRIISQKNAFRSQNQAVWDQVSTARSAALSNKKCYDDTIATAWQVVLTGVTNKDVDGIGHTLNCVNGSNFGTDTVAAVPETILGDTEVDALEIDGTTIPNLATSTVADIRINFISGSAQVRLEQVEADTTVTRIDDFRVVMGHTLAVSDLQQTICINRVAGFPTLNKSGSTCET